jgi:hypothetical protein
MFTKQVHHNPHKTGCFAFRRVEWSIKHSFVLLNLQFCNKKGKPELKIKRKKVNELEANYKINTSPTAHL